MLTFVHETTLITKQTKKNNKAKHSIKKNKDQI
jgi:hypothetical protein